MPRIAARLYHCGSGVLGDGGGCGAGRGCTTTHPGRLDLRLRGAIARVVAQAEQVHRLTAAPVRGARQPPHSVLRVHLKPQRADEAALAKNKLRVSVAALG